MAEIVVPVIVLTTATTITGTLSLKSSALPVSLSDDLLRPKFPRREAGTVRTETFTIVTAFPAATSGSSRGLSNRRTGRRITSTRAALGSRSNARNAADAEEECPGKESSGSRNAGGI